MQSIIAQLIIGPSNNDGKGGGKDETGWKPDGWVRWLEGLRGNYERRMQSMCQILDDGAQLVDARSTDRPRRPNSADIEDDWDLVTTIPMYSFKWPMGGMFIWVRMRYENHPLYTKVDHEKLSRALWVHLTTPNFLVLVTPGSIFAPSDETKKEESWKYFRICFAAVDEDEMEKTSRGFVEGVRDFWGKTSIDDIEALAKAEMTEEPTWL